MTTKMLDAAAVTSKVKELNEANAKGRTEDVIKILTNLKTGVEPNEELLKTSKAGVAVGKLRQSTSPGVSNLAKEVVKLWKEAIEQNKQKRKRDDGEEVKKEDGTKRVKAAADSPAASSPKPGTPSDTKPKKEEIPTASSSRVQSPGEADGVLSTIDNTLKTPRTAALDGIDKTLKVEGAGADDTRDKCVVMLYNALAIDSRAETRILKERALGIEQAAYKSLNASTGNDYRAKIRSLFLNLKDKGNPGLRNKIVLGDVSPDKVVAMSKEDMASESVKAMNQKITENNLFKAKAVGETNAETDAFKCSRCQQRKCTYYQMQTRSADEPMTTFVTCVNCGNKWKFS